MNFTLIDMQNNGKRLLGKYALYNHVDGILIVINIEQSDIRHFNAFPRWIIKQDIRLSNCHYFIGSEYAARIYEETVLPNYRIQVV
jgi:hypothetical protein